MKIVIRRGILHPDIIVVHPVADDYKDIGAFDKVNLRGDDAYKAFKALISASPEVIATELGNINEGLTRMRAHGRYSPPEGSLIAQITPADPDPQLACIDAMELQNLADILAEIKKMKAGDRSITVEDWIENPPERGGSEAGRSRR